MSNVERHLVSKILHDGSLIEAIDNGVTPKFFLEPDHRFAFKMIVDHHAQYGAVPSIEAFKADFPSYRLLDPPDPVEYYVDRLRADFESYLLEVGFTRALEDFDRGDNQAARAELTATLGSLNTDINRSRVVDITQTGDRRVDRYKAYSKRDGSLRGISSGFASIDTYTQGFQPQQLITYVGPPAAGKSTMLLLSMMAAHSSVYTPLFIGFEMSNLEQEERHDAIRAGISHKKLREGRLSADEMTAIRRMMAKTKNLPPLIFSEDANASSTVSGVIAQVERYTPDIVFIDGVYMMEDEHGEKKGSPQALTNITRTLKQSARRLNIPFVISTQVLEWKMSRTKGVTTSSIGYSSSFLQDSDEIVAVEPTDDKEINKVKSLKSRNSAGAEFFIHWDWENGKFEELVERERPEDDGTVTF